MTAAGRDAGVLTAADAGILVGERGSRASRNLADFVLKDAAFPAVAGTIWQERAIFAGIDRYPAYRISCGAAVIVTVAVALLAGLPLPPLQILLLSLSTHVFPAPALGLGAGTGLAAVMGLSPLPALLDEVYRRLRRPAL